MGKTVEEICNSIINSRGEKIPKLKPTTKRLSSSLGCTNPQNPYSKIALYDYEGMYDRLERIITERLASAIDENSPEKIKQLKAEFGHLKEFADAKTFLNRKSKEIWNVYTPLKNVPKDAMKALGITNCPDLDSLLYNPIKYFEKDNKTATATAIASILKNKNMPYDINDIHKYLENMHKSKAVKYNFNTIRYLIYEHHYDKEKLRSLGADKDTIKQAVQTLPLKIRLKFLFDK